MSVFTAGIGALVRSAAALPAWGGYALIAALIALENLFPPIPSEIILTGGGLLTATSPMTVGGVVIAATAGSLAGAAVLYGIGRCCPPARLERWLSGRLGRRLGFRPDGVRRAVGWFDRRGGVTVLLGRCVPVVRSVISIPAGMAAMPPARFFALTAAGTLWWNLVLTLAGRLLGDRLDAVLAALDAYSLIVYIALGAVLCGVAVRLVRRLSARGRNKKEDTHVRSDNRRKPSSDRPE